MCMGRGVAGQLCQSIVGASVLFESCSERWLSPEKLLRSKSITDAGKTGKLGSDNFD